MDRTTCHGHSQAVQPSREVRLGRRCGGLSRPACWPRFRIALCVVASPVFLPCWHSCSVMGAADASTAISASDLDGHFFSRLDRKVSTDPRGPQQKSTRMSRNGSVGVLRERRMTPYSVRQTHVPSGAFWSRSPRSGLRGAGAPFPTILSGRERIEPGRFQWMALMSAV